MPYTILVEVCGRPYHYRLSNFTPTLGHRVDLTTLSSREAYRSKNNVSGLGVGDLGQLGRVLVRGEKGHDTVSELYPLSGEPVIDKPGQSAFTHTDFDFLLRIRGIKNLVVAGLPTDLSVASTIRDASERGLDCLLVRDGIVASQALLQNAACETVQTEGGVFGATASLQDVLNMMRALEKPSEMSIKDNEARTVPATMDKPQALNTASSRSQGLPSQEPITSLAESGNVEAGNISSSQSSEQPTGNLNEKAAAPLNDQPNAPNAISSNLAQMPSASTTQETEMPFAPTAMTNE